mgnify:CR=1 FL=1
MLNSQLGYLLHPKEFVILTNSKDSLTSVCTKKGGFEGILKKVFFGGHLTRGGRFFLDYVCSKISIMEQEILRQIAVQNEVLQKVFVSVEKTRKYFMWTLIITLALFIIPLVGLLFAIPMLLNNLSAMRAI